MNSRLNVHFGVILRKATSSLTFISVVSIRNINCHVALTNREDGMKGLEKAPPSRPRRLCSFWCRTKAVPRGRIYFTSSKDAQGLGR